MALNNEARLGFWALAYLVTLHGSGSPDTAAEKADYALDDFDQKAKDILNDDDDQRAA